MKKNESDIRPIIVNYLDGSATKEDKRTLLEWLKLSETNRKLFHDVSDIWRKSDESVDDSAKVADIMSRLKNNHFEQKFKKPEKEVVKRHNLIKWYRIAAAVVFFCLIGTGAYWLGVNNGEKEHSTVNRLITAKGSKGMFHLPDGSIVWLNSESSLTYSADFSGKNRVVNLVGCALFDVVHDESRPFIVNTGNTSIRVLGTCFNVDNYSNMKDLRVALLRGKIQIFNNQSHSTILNPDELYEYNTKSGLSSVSKVNACLYANWINKRLVFDNDCLRDILISFEGWYQTDIECPEELAENVRMSLTVRQENITEILDAMCAIAPIKYIVSNNKIKVIKN